MKLIQPNHSDTMRESGDKLQSYKGSFFILMSFHLPIILSFVTWIIHHPCKWFFQDIICNFVLCFCPWCCENDRLLLQEWKEISFKHLLCFHFQWKMFFKPAAGYFCRSSHLYSGLIDILKWQLFMKSC